MALFTIPLRLATKAALAAADVAAAFGALVTAINGGLNHANYAAGSWILNAHKASPRTVGFIQFTIPQAQYAPGDVGGFYRYHQRMSTLAPGAMLEWCLTFGAMGGLGSAGAYFRLKRDGVQVGTDYLHGGGTAFVDRREVVASAPVVGDALWTVEIEVATANAIPMVGVTIAVKAPHVR